MQPFMRLTSHAVVLRRDNVDTDQIIPASYLKTTEKTGLGRGLFANWRYLSDGSPDPGFVLNRPASGGARILVAGENFGCGSSREHAPWALADFGFRAIVSPRFAEIFRNNALKNGLLPVALAGDPHAVLLEQLDADAGTPITIDLEAREVSFPGGEKAAFEVDPFARHCLLQGLDQLGYLLDQLPAIEAWEATRAPRVDTLG